MALNLSCLFFKISANKAYIIFSHSGSAEHRILSILSCILLSLSSGSKIAFSSVILFSPEKKSSYCCINDLNSCGNSNSCKYKDDASVLNS